MLNGQIEVVADLPRAAHQPEKPGIEMFRIGVENADPSQVFNLTEAFQKCCEVAPVSEIKTVRRRVLGDKIYLPDPLVNEETSLLVDRRHRTAAKLPLETGNDAE